MFFRRSILPESPRWLVAKQRYEEAEELLKKIAARNKTSFNQATYDQFVKEDRKVMINKQKKRFLFHIWMNELLLCRELLPVKVKGMDLKRCLVQRSWELLQ